MILLPNLEAQQRCVPSCFHVDLELHNANRLTGLYFIYYIAVLCVLLGVSTLQSVYKVLYSLEYLHIVSI